MKFIDPLFVRKFLLAALVAVTLLPLAIHAVGGTGARYFTDDYCIWMQAHDAEPLALIWDWYNSSGGRLAQYLSMALLFKPGIEVVSILPAALLLLWGLGLVWLGVEIARALHLPTRHALIGGLFVLAAIITAAPNRVQALYWMTGILTYPAPALMATFAAALMIQTARSRVTALRGAGIFALTFAAGLFNEPFAFMQTALIGGSLLIVLLTAHRQRGWWRALIIAAAAAGVALLVLVIAPGNGVRQASFSHGQSLLMALLGSLVYALVFSLAAVVFNPFGTIAALLTGMAVPGLLKRLASSSARTLVVLTPQQARWGLIVIATLWIGACAAFMLPGFYATGGPPPARSFIMPLWLYFPGLLILGVLIRFAARFSEPSASTIDRLMGYTVAAVITIHGVWASVQIGSIAAYTLEFGREWDRRAEELAALSSTAEVLWMPLPHDLATYGGLETLGTDPDSWINRCAAEFFDVAAIRSSAGS